MSTGIVEIVMVLAESGQRWRIAMVEDEADWPGSLRLERERIGEIAKLHGPGWTEIKQLHQKPAELGIVRDRDTSSVIHVHGSAARDLLVQEMATFGAEPAPNAYGGPPPRRMLARAPVARTLAELRRVQQPSNPDPPTSEQLAPLFQAPSDWARPDTLPVFRREVLGRFIPAAPLGEFVLAFERALELCKWAPATLQNEVTNLHVALDRFLNATPTSSPDTVSIREPLTQRQAIKIARAAALTYGLHGRYGYLPTSPKEAEDWKVHEWVIEAIIEGSK